MAQVIATTKLSGSRQGLCSVAVGAVVLPFVVLGSVPATPQPATTPPSTLHETGLYAGPDTLQVDPAHLAFAPQYPLWTDGAAKRRWISLPPGTAIDGSDPEAWIFPVGTRFWKEFSFNGQRVETRYLERRTDGQWLYAAYAWRADGREAQLVSPRGKRGAYQLAGGRAHTIPGVTDCKACHQGGASEVLGFGTLQLSPERDAGAPHAELQPEPHVDLRYLVDNSLLVGLPKPLLDAPPRIAAATATERAALGYMHGNCGHCHNERGSLQNVALFLRHSVLNAGEPATTSTVGQPVRKPAPGQSPDAVLRVEPGHPDRSGLMQRVSSRSPSLQMPPLGTELIDDEAVRLLYRWIAENGASSQQAHANAEGR
jgi:mono/diheme cytochrome c family protein